MLTCQFHDVLPGSSIAAVYTDAAAMHAKALSEANKLAEAAKDSIAKSLAVPLSAAVAGGEKTAGAKAAFGGTAKAAGGADSAASGVQARRVLRVWNSAAFARTDLIALPATDPTPSAAATSAPAADDKRVLVAVHVPAYGVTEVPVDAAAALLTQMQRTAALKPSTVTEAAEDDTSVASLLQQVDAAAYAEAPRAQTSSAPAATVHPAPAVPSVASLTELRDPATIRSLRVTELQAAASGGEPAYVIDTGLLRVTISKCTGHLTSVLDYRPDPAAPREIISTSATSTEGGGNRFLLHDDAPFFWDAWDVMPYHREAAVVAGRASAEGSGSLSDHPWVVSVTVQEAGPLRARLRVTYPPGSVGRGSSLQQDVVLTWGSALIEFITSVDWHEEHRLLKVDFPTTLLTPQTAVYETQFGAIERPTHTNTGRDVMQYEVRLSLSSILFNGLIARCLAAGVWPSVGIALGTRLRRCPAQRLQVRLLLPRWPPHAVAAARPQIPRPSL
jgi:alpha-mannosidase